MEEEICNHIPNSDSYIIENEETITVENFKPIRVFVSTLNYGRILLVKRILYERSKEPGTVEKVYNSLTAPWHSLFLLQNDIETKKIKVKFTPGLCGPDFDPINEPL